MSFDVRLRSGKEIAGGKAMALALSAAVGAPESPEHCQEECPVQDWAAAALPGRGPSASIFFFFFWKDYSGMEVDYV